MTTSMGTLDISCSGFGRFRGISERETRVSRGSKIWGSFVCLEGRERIALGWDCASGGDKWCEEKATATGLSLFYT